MCTYDEYQCFIFLSSFFPLFSFFFYIHIVNIVDRSYDGPIYTDFSFGTEKRIFLLLLEKKREGDNFVYGNFAFVLEERICSYSYDSKFL